MRKIAFSFLLLLPFYAAAQMVDPAAQPTLNLQYFEPVENGIFAGDPMTFWHEGTYHVFWLTDYNHQGYGHQWAHMSTKDLVTWLHHPLAVPIDPGNENAICTGSTIYANGKYYAFYATRTIFDGRREFISYATARDGINYTKKQPREFITAPDTFESAHFRDPHLFFDEISGLYYMLITTAFRKAELDKNRYCLIYYTSRDMAKWTYKGPFYFTGSDKGFAYPECADIFKWNDWYYLIYKVHGGNVYRMSKNIEGPWVVPEEDAIANDYTMVLKSAQFGDDRRIAAGFVPSREGNKDDGGWQYGGNLVFREYHQNKDGTLSLDFPPEMLPAADSEYKYKKNKIEIESPEGVNQQKIAGVPDNVRITCEVQPKSNYSSLGLLLRHSVSGHYELSFDAIARQANLGSQTINRVKNLDEPFTLDIVMKNSIIDVCIAGRRCILNRCPEQKGSNLYFFVHNGEVVFKNIKIEKLAE